MKKIIKSSLLLFAFFMFTTTIKAQLASDAPVPAAPVVATPSPVAKIVAVETASSSPIKVLTKDVKNGNKADTKTLITNPLAGQGKEIVRPAADSAAKLPPVSNQKLPAQKS